MSEDKTLEMLRGLIEEVKQETKAGILKESRQPKAVESESKLLKEYVTKNVMSILRESGD